MSYLRNAWYVAAWNDELGDTPLARTLLDEPVVLYRDADGAPVALRDSCPHRFAPLSRGSLTWTKQSAIKMRLTGSSISRRRHSVHCNRGCPAHSWLIEQHEDLLGPRRDVPLTGS